LFWFTLMELTFDVTSHTHKSSLFSVFSQKLVVIYCCLVEFLFILVNINTTCAECCSEILVHIFVKRLVTTYHLSCQGSIHTKLRCDQWREATTVSHMCIRVASPTSAVLLQTLNSIRGALWTGIKSIHYCFGHCKAITYRVFSLLSIFLPFHLIADTFWHHLVGQLVILTVHMSRRYIN
jgi:hypothetical protein